MADDFIEKAKRQLEELQNRRISLSTELNSLDSQIAALFAYVSEMEPEAAREISSRIFMATVDRRTMRPLRKPRGEQVVAVLSVLQEISPGGLDLDAIIRRAARIGVALRRTSVRSQLSKLVAQGRVQSAHGAFYYVAGLEDASPEQSDEAREGVTAFREKRPPDFRKRRP